MCGGREARVSLRVGLGQGAGLLDGLLQVLHVGHVTGTSGNARGSEGQCPHIMMPGGLHGGEGMALTADTGVEGGQTHSQVLWLLLPRSPRWTAATS